MYLDGVNKGVKGTFWQESQEGCLESQGGSCWFTVPIPVCSWQTDSTWSKNKYTIQYVWCREGFIYEYSRSSEGKKLDNIELMADSVQVDQRIIGKIDWLDSALFDCGNRIED